jgi:hypothetical protein
MPVNDPNFDGEPTMPIEAARLAPWEAWMDKGDFEDLWNDEVE